MSLVTTTKKIFYIAGVVKDIENRIEEMQRQKVERDRQIVRLMLDIKNDNLSMDSFIFLGELDIHPDDFDGKK